MIDGGKTTWLILRISTGDANLPLFYCDPERKFSTVEFLYVYWDSVEFFPVLRMTAFLATDIYRLRYSPISTRLLHAYYFFNFYFCVVINHQCAARVSFCDQKVLTNAMRTAGLTAIKDRVKDTKGRGNLLLRMHPISNFGHFSGMLNTFSKPNIKLSVTGYWNHLQNKKSVDSSQQYLCCCAAQYQLHLQNRTHPVYDCNQE